MRRLFAIFKPFRQRDFALLWSGYAISMLGDGVFMVAISWQALALRNSATTLGLVWLVWTIVHLAALTFSGSLVDRAEHRLVLLGAALIGLMTMGAIGALSVTGHLRLWELMALAGIYGGGEAFFGPAFNAIVPDLVPKELLPQANSIRQFIRPFVFRLAGPALGGVLIAATRPGVAFLFDAASFAAVVLSLLLMRSRIKPQRQEDEPSLLQSTKDGFAYVRSTSWLWQALLVFTVTTALDLGPLQVLVPFFVKNHLHQSASGLGLYFAAGGAGAAIASWTFAVKGMPGRPLRVLYGAWTLAGLAAALIGLSATLWQAMLFGFCAGGFAAAQIALWYTLIHLYVPKEMVGRVSSLDWLVSSTFVPLSYGLAGPIAGLIGVRVVIVGAGLIAAALTGGMLVKAGRRELPPVHSD